MTLTEVLLWCQPNDKLVKNKDLTKNSKKSKKAFGLDQLSEKDHNNKRPRLTG